RTSSSAREGSTPADPEAGARAGASEEDLPRRVERTLAGCGRLRFRGSLLRDEPWTRLYRPIILLDEADLSVSPKRDSRWPSPRLSERSAGRAVENRPRQHPGAPRRDEDGGLRRVHHARGNLEEVEAGHSCDRRLPGEVRLADERVQRILDAAAVDV